MSAPTVHKTLKIFVHVSGTEPLQFDLRRGTYVLTLKELIRRRTGMPRHWQRLTYNSKTLMDYSTLRIFKIPDGAHLWLVCQMASCTGQCLTDLHGAGQGTNPGEMLFEGSYIDYDRQVEFTYFTEEDNRPCYCPRSSPATPQTSSRSSATTLVTGEGCVGQDGVVGSSSRNRPANRNPLAQAWERSRGYN